MQIGFDNNIHFTSRNRTIRFADDVARRVNKCFPRVSPTLVQDWHVVQKNKKHLRKFIRGIDEKIDDMREYKDKLFFYAQSVVGKMCAFTKAVKEHRVGNCGESAQLGAIVAKVNGIRNAYLAELQTKRGKDLDHMVVYVDDEKPYIIDPWFGIADYVPNMMQRYKSEYRHHFDLPKKRDNIKFVKIEDDYYGDALNVELSRRQKNKLLKLYPDMLIRRY